VDDDRLRVGELVVLARYLEARRLDAVAREHRRAGRVRDGAHDREVLPRRVLDPGLHAARDEALCGRDAHRSARFAGGPPGLPTSRPDAIEPTGEIATCLQRKCDNIVTIRPQRSAAATATPA